MDNHSFAVRQELGGTDESIGIRCLAKGPNMLISGKWEHKTVDVFKCDNEGNYSLDYTLNHHTNKVSCVIYIPQEDWICTSGYDSVAHVYENGKKEPLVTLKGHTSTVCCLSRGLVERTIITGSWDTSARLWTISKEKEVKDQIFKGHEGSVWAVCTTDDQKYVTGSADNKIIIWTADGTKEKTIEGHTDCLRAILYHNGNLISTGNDKTIKVWDKDGGPQKSFAAHENYIYSMGLLANGRLVTASGDSTVRFWNLSEGKQIGKPITLPVDIVWSVVVLDNGDIATGGTDGIVRIFTENSQYRLKDWEKYVKKEEVQPAEPMDVDKPPAGSSNEPKPGPSTKPDA